MDGTLRKRRAIFAAALVIFGTFYLMLCFPKKSPSVNTKSSADSVVGGGPEKKVTQVAENKEEVTDFSKPVLIDGKPYYVIFSDETKEIKEWFSSKGYFTKEDSAVYESYNDETLKSLGKQGDLLALDLLISRSAGNEKAVMQYITVGAVYGSTTALDSLTIYTAPKSTNNMTEESRRPAALETLAVTKVIEMRGDRSLAQSSKVSFLNSYKRRYDTDLKISDDEQKYVDSRAQEIYDQLQKIRHEVGLGDFDNTEPTSIKKVFGLNQSFNYQNAVAQ